MSNKHSNKQQKRVLLLLGWYTPKTEEGIVRYAREAGWTLDLQTMRTGMLPDIRGIDGILAILGGWGTRSEFTDFVRNASGIPVVDMHADEAETIPAGRVLADNIAVGQLAAEHFLERGFKNCMFACQSMSDWSVREREFGFRTRLIQNGINSVTLECYAPGNTDKFTARHCISAITNHLSQHTQPLGVFAENDDFAMLVLDACAKAHWQIPEDIAILGCGNDPLLLEFSPVPLSSVEHDFVTRSYTAAQLLDRMMTGEPAPAEPIRIRPIGVFLRRSTDILAVEDKRVAQALKTIRTHFNDAMLTPGTIADTCGVNLRTLNRNMQKQIGRTVSEEIRQVRLRHARDLLSTTDMQISEAAARSGFGGLLHLRRTLKRTTGLPPKQWRQNRQETPPL